jgi:hypothetical protein
MVPQNSIVYFIAPLPQELSALSIIDDSSYSLPFQPPSIRKCWQPYSSLRRLEVRVIKRLH